jgi:hypothetical protein
MTAVIIPRMALWQVNQYNGESLKLQEWTVFDELSILTQMYRHRLAQTTAE